MPLPVRRLLDAAQAPVRAKTKSPLLPFHFLLLAASLIATEGPLGWAQVSFGHRPLCRPRQTHGQATLVQSTDPWTEATAFFSIQK
jgi:hypothetical protein